MDTISITGPFPSLPLTEAPAASESGSDALLALASLSRVLDGDAKLSDVGALLWLVLRQIVPADSLALFLPDEDHDFVVIRYAAGVHAGALRGVTRPTATRIAGWCAVNRKSVLNAEPSLDLGFRASSSPALRACIATPLVDSDALVAVLALYSRTANGFTEDHLRLLEVLGPRLASALLDAAIADEDSRPIPGAAALPLKLVHSS
jgi:GAF domain-containing protein